jgi:hypothetical protein
VARTQSALVASRLQLPLGVSTSCRVRRIPRRARENLYQLLYRGRAEIGLNFFSPGYARDVLARSYRSPSLAPADRGWPVPGLSRGSRFHSGPAHEAYSSDTRTATAAVAADRSCILRPSARRAESLRSSRNLLAPRASGHGEGELLQRLAAKACGDCLLHLLDENLYPTVIRDPAVEKE